MSQVLAAAEVGDTLLFKGPKGRFRYERGSKKAIGGCCAGCPGCAVRAQWPRPCGTILERSLSDQTMQSLRLWLLRCV
jgi:hypothetical protein